MRIMVTGAGGPAGVCVIKSLTAMRNRDGSRLYKTIVGVDTNPLGSGLYLSDEALLAPRVDTKDFIHLMLKLAKKARVSMIIPTVEEELIHFARNMDIFEKAGIVVTVSNAKSLLASNDKLKTYRHFRGKRFCPEIYSNSTVKFPAAIKPMDSRGGRGFFKVENRDELKTLLARNDREFGKGKSLIMEFVPGVEYSTYGISDLKGKALAVVPVKRLEAHGTSTKAQIVRNSKVEKVAKEIAESLGLQGPWNVQLMESGSDVKLIEVNPRFAGTVILPDHAGIHFPHLTIKLFLGQRILGKELKCRMGVYMTRYSEEKILAPNQIVS
jgi:carbamoyl-phosphate synthase large subunit